MLVSDCMQSMHAVHAWCNHLFELQPLKMQVSEAEFMTFMLQELDLVDYHELENIFAMFHAMDIVQDGRLSMADVRARLRASHEATSSGAGPSTRRSFRR